MYNLKYEYEASSRWQLPFSLTSDILKTDIRTDNNSQYDIISSDNVSKGLREVLEQLELAAHWKNEILQF